MRLQPRAVHLLPLRYRVEAKYSVTVLGRKALVLGSDIATMRDASSDDCAAFLFGCNIGALGEARFSSLVENA